MEEQSKAVQGLAMTVRLMENYQLLREYAQKGTNGTNDCATGEIMGALRRGREDTAAVMEEIDIALAAIQVAAEACGSAYKVEAFRRRYIEGQTYEQIADDMNSSRNSPGRWCKEIMQKMAVMLFGINGF